MVRYQQCEHVAFGKPANRELVVDEERIVIERLVGSIAHQNILAHRRTVGRPEDLDRAVSIRGEGGQITSGGEILSEL